MDIYEKGTTSSHSPRSPLSPASFRLDIRPQWRQSRVCQILERLGTLLLLRLRFLLIVALLLIITSGLLKWKPVCLIERERPRGGVAVLVPVGKVFL